MNRLPVNLHLFFEVFFSVCLWRGTIVKRKRFRAMAASNITPGTSFQQKQCLIITDSIGTDLNYIFKADIRAKRGYKIDDLTRYVRNELDLDKYNCILILIGTNDLTDQKNWFEYRRNKMTRAIVYNHTPQQTWKS